MLIRNFTNDDIMQYSFLRDINWNKIDKSLSLIIFDDKGNIEAYIIIEQNGVCPEIIYEEDSKSYKIIDIYVADINPFSDGITKFLQLFWLILSQNNILSMFWMEKKHHSADIFRNLRVCERNDYIVYYKSKNHTIY